MIFLEKTIKMKNEKLKYIILSILLSIGLIIFILFAKSESMYLTSESFNKKYISNNKIEKNITLLLKHELSKYDRISIIFYHNGSSSISGIPFLKESCHFEEVGPGIKDVKKQHQNILIIDNYWLNSKLFDKKNIQFDTLNTYNLNKIEDKSFRDTLMSSGVKSLFVKTLQHNSQIAGYIKIENISSVYKYKPEEVDLFCAKVEMLLSKLYIEEEMAKTNSLGQIYIYIFTFLIILALIILSWFGYRSLTKIKIDGDSKFKTIGEYNTKLLNDIEKNIDEKLNTLSDSINASMLKMKDLFNSFSHRMEKLDERQKTGDFLLKKLITSNSITNEIFLGYIELLMLKMDDVGNSYKDCLYELSILRVDLFIEIFDKVAKSGVFRIDTSYMKFIINNYDDKCSLLYLKYNLGDKINVFDHRRIFDAIKELKDQENEMGQEVELSVLADKYKKITHEILIAFFNVEYELLKEKDE